MEEGRRGKGNCPGSGQITFVHSLAHVPNGRQQTATRSLPGWLWLLAGIALGFAGAAVYYVSRPAADTQASAEAGADKGKAANGKKKITIPPKEKSRFDFYDILPNAVVVVPKEATRSEPRASATPADSPPGRFLIQVGAFRERSEADARKANLALLGIESRIEKVTIDNDQTWYRVRVGPERDQRRVETILTRLEENEIKALVMMVPE